MRVALVGAIACLLAAGAFWLATKPRPRFVEADASRLEDHADSSRGRLIFAAAHCASCHAAPGQHDRLRLGGGLALASPFGTFHVPNISPDPKDGIGGWSTVDLANALTSGVAPDGAHYFPAFPYTSYAQMRVEDVGDLIAYLRALPPVRTRTRPPDVMFPFDVRRLVGLWKLFYFRQEPIEPIAHESAAWNRGRYLVEAVAHCAECHSSRDILGGIRPDTRFAGGPDPEGTGFVPNITPARLGQWSVNDLVEVLTNGRTPDGRNVGSSMAGIVHNTAMLPQSDREAIAVYIKSLPPRPTPPP